MTEDEANLLREETSRSAAFAKVALFVAAIALALAILGLFMPIR